MSTPEKVIARLKKQLALRDRFTREHGLAFLASEPHGEMLDEFAEAMPALLGCAQVLIECVRSLEADSDSSQYHALTHARYALSELGKLEKK